MTPKPMCRVLARRGTNQFLREDGTFSAALDEARRFASVTEAVQACRALDLSRMDMLLKFGSDEYDVRIELSDPRSDLASSG